MATELTCKELVEIVTEYLEGALAPGERERFEAHLEGCEGCVAHVRQLETTIRITGALREEDVAPEARELLLAAFRRWRDG